MVDADKESVVQKTLLATCERRKADNGVSIKGRILFAGAIRAVKAKYHR